MHWKGFAVGAVAAGALVAACTQTGEGKAPAGASASASPTQAVPANVPSFKAQIAPVLQTSCAAASGCHGTRPVDWVAMDLRAEAAYASLVRREADTRMGQAYRVKPGDPDASFLVDKLTGHLQPREGKRMPLDPATGRPVEPSPLAGDFLQNVLRPWIAAGAPDN